MDLNNQTSKNRIAVLDCTLRDGGYCNNWEFGYDNTKRIVRGLSDAGVEIIECGFITNVIEYRKGTTRFTDVDQVQDIIQPKDTSKIYVCMINYGEYEIQDIPECDGSSVDGIRVAFHKADAEKAMEFCGQIKEKGYMVFAQPMLTLDYTDFEILELVEQCNRIHLYAMYIVDSFGVMKQRDLLRLFYLIEHNLEKEIRIGYHSHNNMQLSYANAQALAAVQTDRKIVIDSSVFGMGRGAGNLNTELFIDYLNDSVGACYRIAPLLNMIDGILNRFYQEKYWGYSLPNYLSAAYNAHPNYASYLSDKHTLTVQNMNDIFAMMPGEKRGKFDKKYVEELYVHYMKMGTCNEENIEELRDRLKGMRVLLVAPGKSVDVEHEKVVKFAAMDDVVSIGINFDYKYFNTDFIFISNKRRWRELSCGEDRKLILTSNIPENNVYIKTSYNNLLNGIEAVKDNAGLMLIQFLINLGVDHIYVAGMDGYSHDISQNFAEKEMNFSIAMERFDVMNAGITQVMKQYSEIIKIESLTKSANIKWD